jgi:UDP-glucose 6-dehydrogenase
MTGRHGDMYLDVNDDLRGYGGVCLPKDTKAIVKLVEDLNLDLKFFETVDRDNTKFKSTVFSGMRDG